jgi:hypothetical protein
MSLVGPYSIIVVINVPICYVKFHVVFDVDKPKLLPWNLISGKLVMNVCFHINHHVELIVPNRDLGVMGWMLVM